MRDTLEKYIRLNIDFPNKAGELNRIIHTQKRILEELARQKNDAKVKELILITAEGFDVTLDLMEYMRLVLQGVADDVEALREGSFIRNANRLQAEEILRCRARIEVLEAALKKKP